MLLDPEYLYDPDQNVELGSAIWPSCRTAICGTSTIRKARNPPIAAYNTGASNVARSFDASSGRAAKVINAMDPDAMCHLRTTCLTRDPELHSQVTAAQERYAQYDDMTTASVGGHW